MLLWSIYWSLSSGPSEFDELSVMSQLCDILLSQVDPMTS